MNSGYQEKTKGFTLIEAIVLLVMIALAGTLFFTLGETFRTSHQPIRKLVKSTDLQQVMANIRAAYKPYPVWKPDHPYAIGDKIIPTIFSVSGQRFSYTCMQAGKSGATEPDPWTTQTPIADNTVQWAYTSRLPTLSDLQKNLGAVSATVKKFDYDKSTHRYGYYVIENKWIAFKGNTEEDSQDPNILKVTIKNDDGETLTALFF